VNHGDRPRYSVIIPARNEEELLPRLLDTIDAARAGYRMGADAVEVVVADNASTDATAEIAGIRGCHVVGVTERRIASVRNGGAAVARGRILAFVDADMHIHPATFDAIDDALATGRYVAGATGVKLERLSLGIAITYALLIPWVWMLRMDTGVVFCRAEDFAAVGGYDERRSYGEDVQLLVDLKRLGHRRGQRLARVGKAKAIASTRKFDSFGEWHYFRLIFSLLIPMLRSPTTRTELVERYWYSDDR
jgi:glycosyltransferase involved in cell wall biosynthesis